MSVKVVLGAGLALLAAALLVVLLQSEPRRAGSNYVPEYGPVTELTGADEHCQETGLVPGDTGGLDLIVGTYGRPAPELEVILRDRAGRTVSSGRLPAGGPQGHVRIPMRKIERTTADLEACIRTGPGGRTVLYGGGESVRLAWLRPGSESWLSITGTVAHRFGLGKANPLGAGLLALIGLVLAAAWVLALRLLLRREETP